MLTKEEARNQIGKTPPKIDLALSNISGAGRGLTSSSTEIRLWGRRHEVYRKTPSKGLNVMTETTTPATRASMAKQAASPFGVSDDGMPNFEMPKFDIAAVAVANYAVSDIGNLC